MKNRRVFTAILLILSMVFLVSCGKPAPANYNTYEDLDGKVLGMFEMPNQLSVEQINALMGTNFESVATFPTFNEALMALKSGRVDAVNVTKPQAAYTIKTDTSYKFIAGSGENPLQVTMLTSNKNMRLLAQINSAIKTLTDTGELDTLNKTYIEDVSVEEVALPPVIEGADTIKVGVSGDMPPFDYLTADGKPSGYNVALMGAIAREAGFNIEFVAIPFSTKLSALVSDRVDVFFFHGGISSHESIVSTDVYYANLSGGLLVNAES
jgi:ABC-type amino acid transport substrate-binding protein